jgi:hypothetical protein
VFADAGYHRAALRGFVARGARWVLEVVRRAAGAGFVVLRQRPSHRTDYERLTDSGVGMIYLSMIQLMLKRLKPPRRWQTERFRYNEAFSRE